MLYFGLVLRIYSYSGSIKVSLLHISYIFLFYGSELLMLGTPHSVNIQGSVIHPVMPSGQMRLHSAFKLPGTVLLPKHICRQSRPHLRYVVDKEPAEAVCPYGPTGAGVRRRNGAVGLTSNSPSEHSPL